MAYFSLKMNSRWLAFEHYTHLNKKYWINVWMSRRIIKICSPLLSNTIFWNCNLFTHTDRFNMDDHSRKMMCKTAPYIRIIRKKTFILRSLQKKCWLTFVLTSASFNQFVFGLYIIIALNLPYTCPYNYIRQYKIYMCITNFRVSQYLISHLI